MTEETAQLLVSVTAISAIISFTVLTALIILIWIENIK